MFDGMFDVRIATSSNIIDKIGKLQTKMAAKEVAMVVILSELADSDDEKPTRGPTRSWIKRRKENGFFETIIRELILEDLAGFKEMFRMGYADFEKIAQKSCSIPHHWRDYLQCQPYSKISLFFYSVFETKTFEL